MSLGHEVAYQAVDEPSWADALRRPHDLVVIAGGDGTVASVLPRLAGSSVPASLLPLGTANNIASSLGITGAVRALASGWKHGRTRRYDLGTAASRDGETCFVEGLGGGIFAEAIRRDKGDEYGLEDALAVIGELLRNARPQRWQVEVDGTTIERELIAVEALLIRRVGPGIPLAPRADPGDSLLDVVLVGESERSALATYVERARRGSFTPPAHLPVIRARTVRLVPPPGATMRIDDEPVTDDVPLLASTGQHFVRMLIPARVRIQHQWTRRGARPTQARRLRARASYPSR